MCSLMSMAVLVSVIIFSLPMPLQWRMFHSSIIKVAVRARTDADAPVDTSSPSAAPNELEEQGDADSDAGSSSSLVAGTLHTLSAPTGADTHTLSAPVFLSPSHQPFSIRWLTAK